VGLEDVARQPGHRTGPRRHRLTPRLLAGSSQPALEQGLAKSPTRYAGFVSTMNVSLPNSLKEFVEQQAAEKGYSTSEHVRELIRRAQDKQQLRKLLINGARSASAGPADASYFATLRDIIRR
jgi:antitoxin ParD1/3/4